MVDLSWLKSVRVDPQERTVYAEPGVTWGELDRATAAYGLATTGGLVSTTGIAGFTLGGGLGWLMRRFGLACDNLLAAEVVTADGRFLTANATQNADLFWGLRGGGGNFGIVTSFLYRLYPVSTVLGGLVAYPMADAVRVLTHYRVFALAAPDALTIHAGLLWLPDAGPVVALLVCYSGDLAEGKEAVRPLRGLGRRVADTIGPVPYTALQCAYDAGSPAGIRNYWKSSFLRTLSDEVINVLVARFPAAPSEYSNVIIERMGGAVGRAPRESTAFPHRTADFDLLIASVWEPAAGDAANIGWARDLFAAMAPHVGEMVYVNYLGNEGDDRVRAAYGPGDYDRLVSLKNRYDPTNLFRLNQNIQPASTPPSAG
jgi:FAD/FMN-containing dehydrogenase